MNHRHTATARKGENGECGERERRQESKVLLRGIPFFFFFFFCVQVGMLLLLLLTWTCTGGGSGWLVGLMGIKDLNSISYSSNKIICKNPYLLFVLSASSANQTIIATKVSLCVQLPGNSWTKHPRLQRTSTTAAKTT